MGILDGIGVLGQGRPEIRPVHGDLPGYQKLLGVFVIEVVVAFLDAL